MSLYRGGSGRPHRLVSLPWWSVVVVATLIGAGCGKSTTSPTSTTSSSSSSTGSTGSSGASGSGGSSGSSSTTATGAYTVSGTSASSSGQTYTSTTGNQSAILVTNAGSLTLNAPTLTKSGDTSATETSSQYGLNAGLLASAAGRVTINGGSISTSASGANGLFATGTNSTITMAGGSIVTTGEASHGIDVTYGGTITLTDVNVTTSGDSASAALSTDFGGGTLNVTGGTVRTAGTRSPAMYSTGNVTVTNTSMTATGGPGAVIDGANSIRIVNASLTGAIYGFRVFRSAPGSGAATISVSGGSVRTTAGDLLFVSRVSDNAVVNMMVSNGAVLAPSTGVLIHSEGGSTANFVSDGVALTGKTSVDSSSTASLTLRNGATLTGSLENTALSLEGGTRWTLTADSTLTTFGDAAGISGGSITNVVGNGFAATYDASASGNSALGGRTYTLVNGGQLRPR